MLPDANNHNQEESSSNTNSENQESAQMPVACTGFAAPSEPLNLNYHANGESWSGEEFALKNHFVCQRWHRPYAAALMEADPTRLAGFIAEAEKIMAERYLELCDAPVPGSEIVDLQNAAYALSQMKRAYEIGVTHERFVA